MFDGRNDVPNPVGVDASPNEDRNGCGCPGCRHDEPCRLDVLTHAKALRSRDPLIALGAHALATVTAAVPSDGGAWHLIDGRGRLMRAIVCEHEPWPWRAVEAMRSYGSRYRRLDPLSASGSNRPQPVATTADVGHGDFSQHRFAREFLSRIGFGHLAVVTLSHRGRPAAQLWVGRRHERPRFSADERAILHRLHGLVSHSLRHLPAADRLTTRDQLVAELLTPREREVAELAATGATNAEIADTLSITKATVATHLHRTLTKLGVRSRTELARLLLRS